MEMEVKRHPKLMPQPLRPLPLPEIGQDHPEGVAAEDQPEVEEAREEVTTRTIDEDLREMEVGPRETLQHQAEARPEPEEVVPHHKEMVTATERDPREVAAAVDLEMVHPEEAVIERTGPREESEAQGMTPPNLRSLWLQANWFHHPVETPPEHQEETETRRDLQEEAEEAPEETRLPLFQIELDQTEEIETRPDLREETTNLREAEVETSPQTKEMEETETGLSVEMSDLREAETTSPTEETETSHREALPDPEPQREKRQDQPQELPRPKGAESPTRAKKTETVELPIRLRNSPPRRESTRLLKSSEDKPELRRTRRESLLTAEDRPRRRTSEEAETTRESREGTRATGTTAETPTTGTLETPEATTTEEAEVLRRPSSTRTGSNSSRTLREISTLCPTGLSSSSVTITGRRSSSALRTSARIWRSGESKSDSQSRTELRSTSEGIIPSTMPGLPSTDNQDLKETRICMCLSPPLRATTSLLTTEVITASSERLQESSR